MCGIAAYLGPVQRTDHQIRSCLNAMHHRGPDHADHQSWFVNQHVHLLHTRLQIIDLDSRSNMPMSKCGFSLILNGEIYNYLELRLELSRLGCRFSTTSDSEVVLEAFIQWGVNAFERFDGMFALVIVEEHTQRTWIARDRFGEKPLFIIETAESIILASEYKALALLSGQRFSVDYQYLLNYINRGHKTLNKNLDTFYSEVKKFPPGHVMEVSPTLHKKLRPFSLKNTPSIPPPSSFEEAAQQTLEIITQSLRLRLRSDVTMGFCLSGGVDSTALASIATKLLNIRVNSYSIIDHDPRYNEQTNINAVVQDIQSNHHPVFLGSKSENESRLLKLIEQRSAPLGTISYLVHSFLSEQIHQDGHRIAISGTGSDEIFSGYYDHFCWHLATLDPNSPAFQEALNHWNRFVLPLVRNPEMKKPLIFIENPRYRDYILAPISIANQFLVCPIASWFEETAYSSGRLRNRLMNELFHEVVPVILQEDDANSMMFSVENRSPFLSQDLVNWTVQIPDAWLIQNGYNKAILRQALQGVLVDSVRLDREKKGFNAGFNSLFNTESPLFKELILQPSSLFDLYDKSKIENTIVHGIPADSGLEKFFFQFINAQVFLAQCT